MKSVKVSNIHRAYNTRVQWTAEGRARAALCHNLL